MIGKDLSILRWKLSMSLECRSLKDYLCLCFGCHLVVLKRKSDFRNWSLYPLSKPKWAELKRDFRLLLVALLWRLLSPPCGDSLRGLAGLQQLMKAPGESPQSLCCYSWHTWRWVREKLLSRRKGGTCPAAHRQLLCPTFGQTAFQTEIIRQWVPAPWGSDGMETGLAWVGAGRGNRRGNGLQEDAPDSRSLQRTLLSSVSWAEVPRRLHLPVFLLLYHHPSSTLVSWSWTNFLFI